MTLLLLATDILRLFRFRWKNSFWVVFGLTWILLAYGHFHYRHPITKEIDITINKPLITGQKTLKIVAFSDVHLGLGTAKAALSRYVKLINSQQPDLILIGGDLIDNSLVPVKEQKMEEELSRLKAPLGIYMAPGNHDYFGGIDQTQKFLLSTPIILLRDSLILLDNGLQIAGREDRRARSRLPLSEWTKTIDPSKPVILIDHQPYDLDETGNAGIDLQFSGHTHNGQTWPFNLIARRMFELSYGYEKRGDSQIYVSSGLSLWGPPFRIGTDSEIVVFNITFQ